MFLMKSKSSIGSRKNKGRIEVYIDNKSQKLLGPELFVDAAEHMAHLLAWMIDEDLTLEDILTSNTFKGFKNSI